MRLSSSIRLAFSAAWLSFAASAFADARPVDAADAAPVEAPVEPTEAPGFDVFEFRIVGNTTLPGVQVEQVLYPFLGPHGDFARLQAAQAALGAAYRDAGYAAVTVDIPEQEIKDGVVRLIVTEGKVDHLRVTGARYVSGRRLVSRLPSLRPGSVFHLPSAQRELSTLAGEGRRVTPALQAGSRPGTVDVELMVEDELPLRAGLTVSNAASANTSQTRLNGEVGYGNLFQRDHSVSLSYQLTPEKPDEVNAIVGTYVARFEGTPDVLAMYAVRTDSDVSAVGDITVLGQGYVYGVRYVHPLRATERTTSSFTVGADYKDFDDTTTLGSSQLLSDIQYWKAMLSFSATTRRERSTTQYTLGLDVATRHAGNGRREFEDKRFKGETDFLYLTAAVRHEQLLPWWNLRASGELTLRLTEDPLISNEQWGMGGRSSVRGYLESEGLMDWGVGARMALSLPLVQPAEEGWQSWFRTLEARAFVDWQGGWLHEPLPDQKASLYLFSTGVGITARGADGWFGDLDLALPLRDGPFTDAYDPRVLFEVGHDL